MITKTTTSLLAFGAVIVACSLPTRADVLVVSASGGGSFTQISAAVAAAQDGDVILVRPTGSYGGFTLDGKDVSILGDAGTRALVVGRVVVTNVPLSKSALLAHLNIAPAQPPSAATLVIQANAGAVRIEDCVVRAADYPAPPLDSSALRGEIAVSAVDNPGTIALAGCTLQGGRGSSGANYAGYGASSPGGDGLWASNSRVAMHECTATGGRGGDGFDGCGSGAPGARLLTAGATFLHAAGCTFTGGRGGDDWEDLFSDLSHPGNGGHGLLVQSGAAAWLLDDTFVGGAPGIGVFCPPTLPSHQPSPGTGLMNQGNAFTFNRTNVGLSAPAVVREQTTMTLTFRGDPGDELFLFTAPRTSFVAIPSWRGVYLARARRPELFPTTPTPIATIPASGSITVDVPIGALPPGRSAYQQYLQAYRVSSGNQITLGGFAAVTVIDSSH